MQEAIQYVGCLKRLYLSTNKFRRNVVSYEFKTKRMEGYLGSLLKTVSPVDDTTLLGSAKPLVEVWLNKDTFRDRAIIPQWDEDKIRSTRDSDKYASRLGKGVSYILAQLDRKSTRLNSSHSAKSRMPSSA